MTYMKDGLLGLLLTCGDDLAVAILNLGGGVCGSEDAPDRRVIVILKKIGETVSGYKLQLEPDAMRVEEKSVEEGRKEIVKEDHPVSLNVQAKRAVDRESDGSH
ncbi:hypothetical protein HYFRA_00009902 [Hymenoscyphus fraxineus]|uniref:Uncharacterized protein n=1 Tax=Hymenoscyphus fraxineus TaxID=746836 RepID=A0A9N9L1Q1_9HELO|nr:hypothetical protein HYFRA_00009902 [Hymenoscyphus fraxineus]